MKPATIELGGQTYEVRPLNIGQMARLFSGSLTAMGFTFRVLEIGMERCSPKLAVKFDELECSPDEIKAAAEAILLASGMQKPGEPKAEVAVQP